MGLAIISQIDPCVDLLVAFGAIGTGGHGITTRSTPHSFIFSCRARRVGSSILVSMYIHIDRHCRMMHPPTPLPGGLLLDHELRELTHEKERVSAYLVMWENFTNLYCSYNRCMAKFQSKWWIGIKGTKRKSWKNKCTRLMANWAVFGKRSNARCCKMPSSPSCTYNKCCCILKTKQAVFLLGIWMSCENL